MPELPDVELYVEHLKRRLAGATLSNVRVFSPNLLRSFDPPVEAAVGKAVRDVFRLGKRIVIELDDDLFLVIHLMIAGRFKWLGPDAGTPKRPGGRIGLAAFEFSTGTLVMTEAGTKKRASLELVRGTEAVRAMDRGGIEPLEASLEAFAKALRRERHTLKRALTDPRTFSGIGNAYSDEILHRAKLSPLRQTHVLTDGEVVRLHAATREVLTEWVARLREQSGERFPENVTAFRPEMAVHGKYKEPCPVCGAPVQRIRYADNEANYCARCQNDGKLLADRGMSRLLGKRRPKTLDELEGA